jgi:hypothetical protein
MFNQQKQPVRGAITSRGANAIHYARFDTRRSQRFKNAPELQLPAGLGYFDPWFFFKDQNEPTKTPPFASLAPSRFKNKKQTAKTPRPPRFYYLSSIFIRPQGLVCSDPESLPRIRTNQLNHPLRAPRALAVQ